MLVLSRKVNESVCIRPDIRVVVLAGSRGRVRQEVRQRKQGVPTGRPTRSRRGGD